MSDLPTGHRIRAVAQRLVPGRHLDVGAGGGLLEPFAQGPYLATDIATDTLPRDGRRVVATANDLPFADGAADVTTCISVLQYVLDTRGAIRELVRVTRPGGRVIVLVPNLAYVRNLLQLARGRIPWSSVLDDWSGGTLRYFTLHDFAPMLKEEGLEIVEVSCSGRFGGLRSIVPSRAGGDLIVVCERRVDEPHV